MIVKNLGICDYQQIWRKMRDFTSKRTSSTPNEIWILEHNPIFTIGISGEEKDIIKPSTIPIIKTDRGGKITYHSPGQLICYFLYDLKREKISIRNFVCSIENLVIKLLAKYKITSHTIENTPGIYVANKKICSLGLKVSKGYTYHGLALNVINNLKPFSYINPCGNPNLLITKTDDLATVKIDEIKNDFCALVKRRYQRSLDNK